MDGKLDADRQEPAKESIRAKLEYYQELIRREEKQKREEGELEI